MAAHFTEDHPGTLHLECRGDLSVKVEGLPKADAEAVLAKLSRRETARIEGPNGVLYVVDGLSLIVAHWEPNR